jgi:hypothetical protein
MRIKNGLTQVKRAALPGPRIVGVMPLASAALLALVVLLGVGLVLRRRPWADKRVRLREMLRLQRVPPPEPRDPAAAQDSAAAEHRCAECASKELCDELLRKGDTKGFRKFCPNALYIEHLRSKSLHFD